VPADRSRIDRVDQAGPKRAMKCSLVIYDFDGTLAETDCPEAVTPQLPSSVSLAA
jgi:hypothetical protein